MIKKRLKQCAIFLIVYFCVCCAFYYIGGEQLQYSVLTSNLQDNQGFFPQLAQGTLLEQSFYSSSDTLDWIAFRTGTFGRENEGTLEISLIGTDPYQIYQTCSISAHDLQENDLYRWNLDPSLGEVKDKQFILRVESTCPEGMAPTIYCSSPEKGTVPAWFNQEETDKQMVFQFSGKKYEWFGQHYWGLVLGLSVAILLYMAVAVYKENRGKRTLVVFIDGVWKKYRFLIRQLVTRDFKTKYKRSVLGYCWSFLNPLLTMMVQYVIFSNLFKSDIENFPVYLLTGTILFSFFQEAVGQGLISVLANASLITKVYMPKYIYPVTKVISSSINLIISFIPLLIVVIITGESITPAFLLLPFAVICLLLFCIGLSMILSAAMVFFRDTQYLWGIVSLIWMYMTPIFYPERIIPEQIQFVLKCNPLYHIIKFVRIILIQGISPEPRRYLYCLVSAVLICIAGAAVFKKTQDKFVLYI